MGVELPDPPAVSGRDGAEHGTAPVGRRLDAFMDEEILDWKLGADPGQRRGNCPGCRPALAGKRGGGFTVDLVRHEELALRLREPRECGLDRSPVLLPEKPVAGSLRRVASTSRWALLRARSLRSV